MAQINGNNPPSVSLRDFIDEKFDHVDERFEQHQREHEQHEIAHKREHADSQKAIDTAATLAERTSSAANEWRGAMDDNNKLLATKVDIVTLTSAVNELKRAEIERAERERLRLVAEADEKARLAKEQTDEKAAESAARSSSQWRIGTVIAIASIVSSVLISLVIRLTSA